MSLTNKAAVRAIEDNGIFFGTIRAQAKDIVEFLVNDGFIEADVESDPEKMARLAKEWLFRTDGDRKARDVWFYVSGWSTDSWVTVLEQSGMNISGSGPEGVKKITEALLILAKEAGVVS